jgi:transglutaminase-like putative cysteine protease
MHLSVDVAMTYRLGPSRRAMLAVEAARCPGQEVVRDALEIDAARLARIGGESGVGTRTWAHLETDEMRLRYRAEVDVTRPDRPLETRGADPMHALPAEALTFLRPSRFCQSDEFGGFVANRFGDLEGGGKVAAIRDWVGREITYLQASSHQQTTVLDTFARREGVCRDFAHMVCALVRAAGIPARYASAYGLGVTPEDFHAVAEVWLDGGWHLVDATGMCTPDGMAVIGVGRDACDAPFMETEDDAELVTQSVTVRLADGPAG